MREGREMTRGGKIFVGLLIVAVIATGSVLAIRQARDRGIEVRLQAVERRDLTSVVTASGNIRARLSVDISSDVQGRVVEVAVREGDLVEVGQLLLRIDPTQLLAAESRSSASLEQAKAQVTQQQATLLGAQRDLDRLRALRDRDAQLVTQQQFDDTRTRLDVSEAQLNSLQFGVSQAEAALEEARDRLAKATITSPIAGRVTRLNMEEGETIIVGFNNNSVILTIGDLQSVEAVIAVDETEVTEIALGDIASVEVDAFP